MDWREDIWFFDTEVLPHDWLFCAMNKKNERVEFHNDTVGLMGFLHQERPFLCGFNCKHYDNYILKAVLSGGTPEDVKEVNDAIIVDGINGWEIDMGWVTLPPSVDLMNDLPTRPSLKLIEGNLMMNIQESLVGFDTEAPTKDEWRDLVDYCWHDVEALVPLYEAREPYLEAKETLANMAGIDVKKALNMTNAKLTALFLGANKIVRTDERYYVYPDNLKKEYVPSEVFEFFDRLPEGEIDLDILFGKEGIPDENGKVVKSRNPYKNLVTEIADCPTVIGWGGIHSALKNYREATTDERIIINADVTSYYPSLMIVNGYLSRNIDNPEIFKDVFDRRILAKADNDTKTADALKLVLNTTYGASNNRYNDLYDPLMAHSVCISGQLYLIQLAESIVTRVPTVKFIQLNTDGIMFSVDRKHQPEAEKIVVEWEKQTGFNMEYDYIEKIIQRDVNNYVMRDVKGKIKVKGGVVSDWKGGDFKHNSLAVVCKAVVNNLLDDTPVEKTIEEEDNPFKFQMIMKSGGSFDRVVHEVAGMEVQVNKVNRLYATKNEDFGAVYKMKGLRRNRVPNCPDHTIVDNLGDTPIDKINKQWYIELALERVQKFIEGRKHDQRRRTRSRS